MRLHTLIWLYLPDLLVNKLSILLVATVLLDMCT